MSSFEPADLQKVVVSVVVWPFFVAVSSIGRQVLPSARVEAGATGLAAAGVANSRITWIPFALSLAACLVVSTFFGVHPARKAARIDPAVALRDRVA